MTTKINFIKDPNSNAILVKSAKGETLRDFVFEILKFNTLDSRGSIYIYDTNDVIHYENGKIASDSELIFSLYSDCRIEDITGYVTYGYPNEFVFTVYLIEGNNGVKEESESEFIEDSKDDLSDSSYRNRAINTIRDTWTYGIHDKYCNLDLTKLSDKGLHALENSLLNLDFVLNQIEKGRYEE